MSLPQPLPLPLTAPLLRLLRQLRDLAPGQRAWFWLCPSAQTPLLLAPLDEDPAMIQLRQSIQQLGPTGSAPAVLGILSLGDDGRVDLGAPQMTRKHLRALAAWVRSHAHQHDALAVLWGARAHLLDARFAPLHSFEDAALWEGMAEGATAPGTIAAASQALATLRPGQIARFWASLDDAAPLILLSTDPDVLRADVRQAVRRIGRASRTLEGVIACQADGALRCASAAPARKLQVVLAALQEAHSDTFPVFARLLPLDEDEAASSARKGERAQALLPQARSASPAAL